MYRGHRGRSRSLSPRRSWGRATGRPRLPPALPAPLPPPRLRQHPPPPPSYRGPRGEAPVADGGSAARRGGEGGTGRNGAGWGGGGTAGGGSRRTGDAADPAGTGVRRVPEATGLRRALGVESRCSSPRGEGRGNGAHRGGGGGVRWGSWGEPSHSAPPPPEEISLRCDITLFPWQPSGTS